MGIISGMGKTGSRVRAEKVGEEEEEEEDVEEEMRSWGLPDPSKLVPSDLLCMTKGMPLRTGGSSDKSTEDGRVRHGDEVAGGVGEADREGGTELGAAPAGGDRARRELVELFFDMASRYLRAALR